MQELDLEKPNKVEPKKEIMKHIFLMSIFAVLVPGIFAGCNSMKKLQREVIETAVIGQVTPAQLEAVDGKVSFDYVVKFAPKQFDRKTVLKITPRMQYGNQVEKLPSLYLQGDRVKNPDYRTVDYLSGTTVTQKLTLDFKEGMQRGVLWADIEAVRGNKAFALAPVVLNDGGVKVWQNHALRIDSVKYVPVMTEFFVEEIPAERVGVIGGYVLFPLSQAKITDVQQHSAVMERAAKAVKQVAGDTGVTFPRMLIYASSSPEGMERRNKSLTANRFKSAKAFFEKDLGVAGLPGTAGEAFIVRQLVNENWEGLYLLLEASGLKDGARMIVEMKAAPDNDKREVVLESYIRRVPELRNDILPLLRRADFFLFYTLPDTLLQESRVVYYAPQADAPTPAVATQKNWRLLNDLAVVALRNREYAKARKLLEVAIALRQEPALLNNLGITYAAQGEVAKAGEMLNKAKVRKEALFNMGLLLLQQGEYAKAVGYLKGTPSIYLAYAQLQAGENRAAWDTFKHLKPTTASEYYLMAVAAARMKDIPAMEVALNEVFRLDPALRQHAMTDVEFRCCADAPIFR